MKKELLGASFSSKDEKKHRKEVKLKTRLEERHK